MSDRTARFLPVLIVLFLTGCGGPPSDASLLSRECGTVRGQGYDWSFATVDRQGLVTGIAYCGSDGSVTSWAPRPSGSGDRVVVATRGWS